MKNIDEILRYFPNKIYQIFFNLFQENSKIAEELQEIRMRAERPIILKLRERDLILQYNITQAEILQIVERLCENSIYAYKNQICEGFITVKGGHRIGLTGSCVIENGKIISNEIPQELAGKYVNTNSKDSYIELSNENIAVSEPTGSGTTNVFENDAVKVNIYYLKYNDYTKQQYIIIEFYVENDGYNNKRVYTYIGQKSSHDNKFEFKSVESTPMAGEGQNSYPYKQQ